MRFIGTKSFLALLVVMAFFASLGAGYAPSGSGMSPYLVGFYDADGIEEEAEVFLANPGPSALEALVVIFDEDGNPVDCERILVVPNDLEDFDLRNLPSDEGMIKVVSVVPGLARTVAQSGIVGWVRTESEGEFLDHTELTPVPVGLLRADGNFELNLIVDYVEANCTD